MSEMVDDLIKRFAVTEADIIRIDHQRESEDQERIIEHTGYKTLYEIAHKQRGLLLDRITELES